MKNKIETKNNRRNKTGEKNKAHPNTVQKSGIYFGFQN